MEPYMLTLQSGRSSFVGFTPDRNSSLSAAELFAAKEKQQSCRVSPTRKAIQGRYVSNATPSVRHPPSFCYRPWGNGTNT